MLITFNKQKTYLSVFPHYHFHFPQPCVIFSFQDPNIVPYGNANFFLFFHFRLAMRFLVVNYVILVIFLYTLFFIILTNQDGLDEDRNYQKVKHEMIFPGSKSDEEEQESYTFDENLEEQILFERSRSKIVKDG